MTNLPKRPRSWLLRFCSILPHACYDAQWNLFPGGIACACMALSGCSPPSSLPIRSAKVYLNDAKNYMHQVRLPEQALKDGAANCLDMAVLFASLMVSCQIDPLILFAPGHAVVGWRDGAGGMEFMQTTGIAELSFEEACQQGRDLFHGRGPQCAVEIAEQPANAVQQLVAELVPNCKSKRIGL